MLGHSFPTRRSSDLVAVSEDAHSSITNALRILEMDALIVRADDHLLTGAGLRAAVAADGSFIPPSAWEGETVARFAFLHPHTSIDLVRQILDRMA